MHMKELTARQAEILQLIRDTIEETGFPPTRAEIARILGFASANAAEEHLKALARKGAIELMEGTARGIRLAQPLGVPLIGPARPSSPKHISRAAIRSTPRCSNPAPIICSRCAA